jgi:hypothetical protein
MGAVGLLLAIGVVAVAAVTMARWNDRRHPAPPASPDPAARLSGTAVAESSAAAESNRAAGGARALRPAPAPSVPAAAPKPAPAAARKPAPEVMSMEANSAVMVTVELEFAGPLPGIAQALAQIERRSEPDDRLGRTFAILDAYGEPTLDGRKLHLSMHVSAEKPGLGSLVDRRSGQVLWQAVVTPAAAKSPSGEKQLTILIDDGGGKAVMVDGSRNPQSILDATLRDSATRVREFWPDGIEREVTFIYSACGCPVKAMVRRSGERTVRTRDLPVMFPDDPAALQVISRLMGWS